MANGTENKPNGLSTQKKPRIVEVRDFLLARKDQLGDAMQKHMDPDRIIRLALTGLLKNDKLLKCDVNTIYLALLTASQLGLEPDGRNAHLISYGTECQFQADYKGLIKLAYQNPRVRSFTAHAVRENDDFEFAFGSENFVRHRPCLKERGNLIAAYAVVKIDGFGEPIIHVMGEDEILKRRDKSRARSGDVPWSKWPDEMWAKTVCKQIAKFTPLGPAADKLVEWENDVEAGRAPGITIDMNAPAALPNPNAKVKTSRLNSHFEQPATSVPEPDPQPEPIVQSSSGEPSQEDFLHSALQDCSTLKEVDEAHAAALNSGNWRGEKSNVLIQMCEARRAELKS